MGTKVELTTSDEKNISAYVAQPQREPVAGVVVLQEIFGVTKHIQKVADGYAQAGFTAIAPALFDRAEPGLDLNYDDAGMKKGISIALALDVNDTLKDIQAAIAYLHKSGLKKVGVVGFCWGGTLAWLANTRLKINASVSYYGGRISQYAAEQPGAPAIMHFGEQDAHIPTSEIEAIRAAHPEMEVYMYPAGHAFNRDVGESYNPEAAKLARERTLTFLRETLLVGETRSR
jgi:carboxymethylenebutenolidase